jgi:hypothetical protein
LGVKEGVGTRLRTGAGLPFQRVIGRQRFFSAASIGWREVADPALAFIKRFV